MAPARRPGRRHRRIRPRSRRTGGSLEGGGHDGDPVGHVLKRLVHRGAVVELARRVGRDAKVGRGQPARDLLVVDPTGERDPGSSPRAWHRLQAGRLSP